MKRLTLALLAVCAVGVGSATVVFSDGFETGDFSKWPVTFGSGGAPVVTTARARSGLHSAHVVGPASGGTGFRYAANIDTLGQPIVRLSAWVFDQGGATTGRQFIELRSMTGIVTNGLWAIGVHNSVKVPPYTGGSFAGTRLQARVMGAPEWFNLTALRATAETARWRRFQIEVTPTHSRFFVDGVLDTEVARYGTGAVNQIRLNSGFSSTNYETWIDDVSVEAVPEPASLLVLGAGALALLRRRKR